jgi:uncharacterized protein (DUF2147 family)
MRTHRLLNGLAAVGLLICLGVGPAAADPRGVWQAMDGSKVRIANCGAALCGTMVSMNPPNDPATGRPWTDKHNRDPSKTNRPLIGLMVLISMRPNGTGKWSGQLYDNDRGDTFEGHLIEQSPTTIRVEGCALGICGGENMTRVGK